MTAVAQECRFDVGLMEPNSDFDGNTVLPSASSWWLKEGSWFAGADTERKEDVEGATYVAGARTQNRFDSKGREPLGAVSRLEARFDTQAAKRARAQDEAGDKAALEPPRPRGATIAESLAADEVVEIDAKAAEEAPSEAAGDDAAMEEHEWRFNFGDWRWERGSSSAVARQGGGGGAVDATRSTLLSANKRRRRRCEARSPRQAVAGYDAQLRELRSAVTVATRGARAFKALGARPARGVLLVGPPGVGKSVAARAVADELGCHVETVLAAEIVSSVEGEAEKELRAKFDAARIHAPSVIILDEVDALVPAIAQGSGAAGGGGVMAAAAAQARLAGALIACLDGLANDAGAKVAVVATTQRAGCIDGSLRRAGRLGKEIVWPMPSDADRMEILRLLCAGMPLEDTLELSAVADSLRGRSGADVSAACSAAAMGALRDAVTAAASAGLRAAPGGAVLSDLAGATEEELDAAAADARVTAAHFLAAVEQCAPSALRPHRAAGSAAASWEDVGGLEAAREALLDLIDLPVRHASRFRRYGVRPQRGCLLYGPPGCGKTLLARAVAGECESNFVHASAADLLSKWMGESEAAVRRLFEDAASAAPCVVFIDEIDAIAACRSGTSGGGDAGMAGSGVASRVLNQLLTEMDGVAARDGVFVIGATNRPLALDDAILRPGRLDRLVHVPLPTAEGRAAVAKASLRKAPLAAGAEDAARRAAMAAEGLSGADVALAARMACTAALREEVQAEREAAAEGDAMKTDCASQVEARHVQAAFACARASVSARDAEMYSVIERSMAEGGAGAAREALEAAREAAREAAEKRDEGARMVAKIAAAVKSDTARSAEKRLRAAEARVRVLEAALQEAGLAVPVPVNPESGEAAAAASASLEEAILQACRDNPDGLSTLELSRATEDAKVSERAEAINRLLAAKKLTVYKKGSEIFNTFFKETNLGSVELLVLQYIRDSGNMGIGLGDLKRRTSLQYPTVGAFHLFKILRNLESRQVIKKVNAQSVNRMVYMLYDLEPHRDITGTPSPTEAARPSTSSSDAGAAAGSLTALDFSSMRVRELKAYLQARRVDMNDVLERSELETLCEATRRAALGDPPRAASGRACAGPSSATTTGQPDSGDEPSEASGVFARASEEEISRRTILRARRPRGAAAAHAPLAASAQGAKPKEVAEGNSDAAAAAGSLTALDFSSMRVRELKAYLQARRVDMNDVLERSELETLCEATRRAALGDPPRAASGRACAGPSSATTTGQPEEAGEEEKEAPPACVQCGKTEAEAREEGGKLRICSLCHAKTERYCCRECQVAHWPTHRRSCAGYERKRKKGKARE